MVEKFSKLDLDGGYTGNIYPLCVRLYIHLSKKVEIIISLRILSVTVRRSYLMDYQCTPDVHKKARVRKIFYVVRAHFAHI